MTKEEIQAKIVELMREIREKQKEIWKLVKRRDEIDTQRKGGESD